MCAYIQYVYLLSGGLSPGAIAGIAIGCTAAIIVVAAAIIMILKKKGIIGNGYDRHIDEA